MKYFSICLFIWHLLKSTDGAVCKLCSVDFHCFIIVHAIHLPHFFHSAVRGYVSWQFGALTNDTHVNIFSRVSYSCVGFLLSVYLKVELLNHRLFSFSR